jgi:hypothetical protein
MTSASTARPNAVVSAGAPPARLPEGRARDDQDGARHRGTAGVRPDLREDERHPDQEDDREDREGDLLEHLHQVVPEHRDAQGDHHREAETEVGAPAGQRGERQRPADAVHGQPAQTAQDGVEAGGKQVAAEAERLAAQRHLRQPRPWPPRGEHTVEHRAECVAQHQRGDGLPEAQPEDEHGEDPDEHGGELHVRRRPDPGLLVGAPVALLDRDRLGAARLDGRDPGAVLALQGLE